MAVDYEAVDALIRSFISDVKKQLPIDKVYLYGSYARKEARWDSDVDLCFFSRNFENTDIFAVLNRLWEIKRKYNDQIIFEPNAFPLSELEKGNPFVKEIQRTGIEVI